MIKVKCQNPDCGKVYFVKEQFAGKRGRCADCGTIVTVPPGALRQQRVAQGPAPAAQPRPDVTPAPERRPQPAAKAESRQEGGVPEVRVGCIGRGHAGKTVLFHALGESLLGEFLPSGLHVDADDPRGVARMIREAEAAQRLLEQTGLPPTLQISQTRYGLFHGDRQLAAYALREVVGQILTHTVPDSAAELQARYDDYIKDLITADVLWVVVPCPPANPDARDRRRYANDLHITLAYLREALRLRPAGRPASVALVLSKVDTLFDDAEEARESLTDEVLRSALGPLVNLIDKSARVADAAILPVTAFGFGNAVLREGGNGREGTTPEAPDDSFGSEPTWLLPEGVSPKPYNLDALFLWTLLQGLRPRAADAELEEVCHSLRQDFDATGPWLLPLKGGIENELAGSENG
jgi:hypothetical protein